MGEKPEPASNLSGTGGPPLPSPWEEVRRFIQAGWRAEFGPPGPDGTQPIRWVPPGSWGHRHD